MKNAYSKPVLVTASGAETLLERINVDGSEEETFSEEWLQELLYRHPAALPMEELDRPRSVVVPVCREMRVGKGFADVVYLTSDGRPVIVEAKLWRNPEALRKVVGQILEYAKELARWDFVDFNNAVKVARSTEDGGAGKGIFEVMQLSPNSADAAQFHDALASNLRRGEFLLLIVGDGIRENVREISEFLEEHASLHFTLGLLEVAVFHTPGGGKLIQPRVLALTSIIRRVVVDVRTGTPVVSVEDGAGEVVEEAGQGGPPGQDRTEIRERFRAFWSAFLEELRLDDRSQPLNEATVGQNQYFRMPEGTTASVCAYLAQSTGSAGVYLTFARGALGDQLFEALQSERAAVEKDLGMAVEWTTNKSGLHYVSASSDFPGQLLGDQAPAVRRVLCDWTNRFVNTFRGRLERLAREID